MRTVITLSEIRSALHILAIFILVDVLWVTPPITHINGVSILILLVLMFLLDLRQPDI